MICLIVFFYIFIITCTLCSTVHFACIFFCIYLWSYLLFCVRFCSFIISFLSLWLLRNVFIYNQYAVSFVLYCISKKNFRGLSMFSSKAWVLRAPFELILTAHVKFKTVTNWVVSSSQCTRHWTPITDWKAGVLWDGSTSSVSHQNKPLLRTAQQPSTHQSQKSSRSMILANSVLWLFHCVVSLHLVKECPPPLSPSDCLPLCLSGSISAASESIQFNHI